MPKERIHKGKSCRFYRAESIWVSSDGTVAGMSDKKDHIKDLPIKSDFRGKYVIHEWYGRVGIAEAVMVCFGPRYPTDGKQYVISFKDGNKENCNKSNLQWLPYHYQHATSDEVKIDLEGISYTVRKDGTILKGKKTETILDSLYDSDVELDACINPYIAVPKKNSIHHEHIWIDEIMRRAGFIQGDDAGLLNPAILHRDNDWKNFASDNLEWTEATDQRYLDYQAKKQADMKLRSQEINKGKPIPDYWI